MQDHNSEQHFSSYIGEIFTSLAKEAAAWKAKAFGANDAACKLAAENEKLKVQLAEMQSKLQVQDASQFLKERGL